MAENTLWPKMDASYLKELREKPTDRSDCEQQWIPAPKDGTTTKQMQDAPERAIFVWPVARSLSYARDLARHLGRDDLEIVPPVWLEEKRWQGASRPVILDHAALYHMTDRQVQAWRYCAEYLARRLG